MFQTSAPCSAFFPLQLSPVRADVAQDHHLGECKLVSSFFLWTLPALSIPSRSTHACHLTHTALRVSPRVPSSLFPWDFGLRNPRVSCQLHPEFRNSQYWWTWQLEPPFIREDPEFDWSNCDLSRVYSLLWSPQQIPNPVITPQR